MSATKTSSVDMLSKITSAARHEPDSGILAAVIYGFNRPGLIPLWAGEGNLPTPEIFCQPAIASLTRGDTFYTYNRGIPELRQALVRYHQRIYGKDLSPDHFTVTSGGMQAFQMAIQLIAAAGDEIIIPSPAWPNYAGPLRLMGATPVEVPMDFINQRWQLDRERVLSAINSKTRAIILNSPSNPLGWTATREELLTIRDACRKHGIWIVADEVYGRFFYDNEQGQRAPSFLDICDPDEQLLLVNTFSKNWAMTGWRVGWIQAPQKLGPVIERLIQYNTSGTASFLQHGCIAALDQGEDFIAEQVQRARYNRDRAVEILSPLPQLSFQIPDGAFYLFVKIAGMTDSMASAKRLIDEANVGFAPGSAFGATGEGHLRLCFLRDSLQLEEALHRFSHWLQKNSTN